MVRALATPLTQAFPAAGGHGLVDVSFVYQGTSWAMTSNDFWIAVSQTSADGNGVDILGRAQRHLVDGTGSPTSAQTVTITQEADGIPTAVGGSNATDEDQSRRHLERDRPGQPAAHVCDCLGSATGHRPHHDPHRTGAYTYTPNPNATGTDIFTFREGRRRRFERGDRGGDDRTGSTMHPRLRTAP